MTFDTWQLEVAGIQLIDGDRGKNYPKQTDFLENGYCLFLSAKNVTIDGFVFAEQVYINNECDVLLRAGKLIQGDIVVTTRGTIGNVAFYDDTVPFENVRINSGMMIFRADDKLWNRRFLYFLLTSEFIKQQIISLTSGSAVPQLPARDLKKFTLPKIPLGIQNQIAKVVGSVADKIELNRQINQTLEQIAQAIFYSWFVDFEPVKAKIEAKAKDRDPERAAMCAISGKTNNELDQLPAEQHQQLTATAALFPDELVESELGVIPKGWEVTCLGSVCTRVSMGPFGSDIKKDNFIDHGVPLIRGGNLRNGLIDDGFVFISEEKADQLRNANAHAHDIVITHRGTLGQVGIIPKCSAYERYVVSQSQMVLSVDRDRTVPRFVFEFLRSSIGQHQLLANTSQVGVPAIARPTSSVKAIPLVIPNIKVLRHYEAMAGLLADMIVENDNSSRTLATLRDTLLPKLLSGEVSVGECK